MKKVCIAVYLKRRQYERVKGAFGGELNTLLKRYFANSWKATSYEPKR